MRHLLRTAGAAALVSLSAAALAPLGALQASAQQQEAPATDESFDRLYEALLMPQMLAVMREEGLVYGETMAEEMLPGGADAGWAAQVSEIYEIERLEEAMRTGMRAALDEAQAQAAAEFFTSEPGQSLAECELEARRDFLDPEVEARAKEEAALALADEAPRMALIDSLIEAGDIIEQNVAGGLNANVAFFTGLMQGGAGSSGGVVDEGAILSQAWAQEPVLRQATTTWAYAFLDYAYAPIEDEALEQYEVFYRSDAGRALNQASFEAYDAMSTQISRALGLALAERIGGQEI
ncbi:DUF2059 domain-containing protein [Pseudoroseicyclus aestuarii]|uniref:Uncharacterized protein DUF2059 n=1 Tax=Pseudoroseicyclus aestuarii TaxID=1795041 RepID=A0A318T0A2_9RHOB|nr:DUF2059 domain-containing protein [Pseudoroseicyclus aestuarii]PYE86146.1 uncharacterized protein DUF2059 [Pseudoroseicyclus aestuarii]